MSVILIGENILESGDFLSATEQEGERWAQPTPTSTNAGSFRLVTKGTPTNFSYSGTATSNGAAGGTTVIDSVLCAFGEDFFKLTGTVTMTSGTCNGESKLVTSFAQATGTLTTAAFSAQIDAGDTFTLTLLYYSKDFRIELIDSGDAGSATFKWSHTGGFNYLGRDSPNQATYLAPAVIATVDSGTENQAFISIDATTTLLIGNADGDLTSCWATTNNGITWALRSTLTSVGTELFEGGAILLKSGRIYVSSSGYDYYSDDSGYTWTSKANGNFRDFVQCEDGGVIGVIGGSTITMKKSYDEGATWNTATTIASDTNTQNDPSICIADNGDLICCYASDEDAVNDYEIKCKISSDNGATWGSSIAVINFTVDKGEPWVRKDINGDLYCAAYNNDAGGDDIILLSRSTDNGATWSTGSILTVASAGGKEYRRPFMAITGGHELWIGWFNATDTTTMFARRGIWEAYSANACPVAPYAQPQLLVCGAEIVWHGGAGIAADDWSFVAEYDFAMSNIIEDSPSRPWRSEQDNIACTILIDMSATGMIYATGVAFFGCNVRTLKFQMNATDSWGSPSVDESVSFDTVTGGVLDSNAAGNEVHDAALLASYKDHELAGYMLRFTSGTLSGYGRKIIDNVGEYILCDGTTDDAASGDTFIIYQDRVSKTFTGGLYRYARISIDAQRSPTSDGFYQIGMMIAGKAITLTDAFGIEYGRDHNYGIEYMDTAAGGVVPVVDYGRKRKFMVKYEASSAGRKEVLALVDYLEGKNIALILDHSNMKDCHLVKLRGAVTQVHQVGDYFSAEMQFEEVL